MIARLLLAAVLVAVAVALLGSGWVWAARRYRARRMVRGLRTTSGSPACRFPTDAAVCAANRLNLTPAQRRAEERALEALLALPCKEMR